MTEKWSEKPERLGILQIPRSISQGWPALSMERLKYGVADGARTHDNWNHNPGLYQLSYSHR
jgi:hypothetical protein